jgi:hypothetical protein
VIRLLLAGCRKVSRAVQTERRRGGAAEQHDPSKMKKKKKKKKKIAKNLTLPHLDSNPRFLNKTFPPKI